MCRCGGVLEQGSLSSSVYGVATDVTHHCTWQFVGLTVCGRVEQGGVGLFLSVVIR